MINKLKNIASYFYPLIVERTFGKVSPYLEVTLFNGKYILNTSKVNYSYGSLYKIFDQTFHKFNLKDREVKNALILGFGAGSVASLLTEKYDIECDITGVEKDSIVIDLTNKYFNISRFKNLELICEDAYKFVQTCSKNFDVIIVDIFIDDQVPICFHKKEFIKQLDHLLRKNGVLFFNKMVSNSKQKNEFNELASNIEEIFGNSLTYKFTNDGMHNYLLIHDRGPDIVKNSFDLDSNKSFLYKNQFTSSLN